MSRRCVLQLLRLQWCGATQYAAVPQSHTPSQPGVARSSAQPQVLRCFHSSSHRPTGGRAPAELRGGGGGEERSRQPAVAGEDLFEQVCGRTRTKDGFTKAVDVFIGRDVRRRGHVEFIYAALKKMPEFGVEKELAVYNKLLDVFPKEVFVPRNFIQRMFNHYPRQQECGVQLLEQMENYGVMPNTETKVLLVQIFGEKGHPMRKYQRIMYWFPKFKNLNPFPVPQQLPQDPLELARLSLNRIANDRDANITVYQAPGTEVTDSGEERTLPHIIGIQSPAQMELLAQHSSSRPVFVEGPFPLWLRKTCVYYYVLRAEPTPPEDKVEERYDPERCLDYPLQLDLDLERDLGDLDSFDVDELDEGPVFAMCMTSQGDQATLNQWISGLQRLNPVLGRVPTLFRLHAGPRELQGPPHHQQAHADPRRTAADSQEPEPTEDEEEESRQRQTLK